MCIHIETTCNIHTYVYINIHAYVFTYVNTTFKYQAMSRYQEAAEETLNATSPAPEIDVSIPTHAEDTGRARDTAAQSSSGGATEMYVKKPAVGRSSAERAAGDAGGSANTREFSKENGVAAYSMFDANRRNYTAPPPNPPSLPRLSKETEFRRRGEGEGEEGVTRSPIPSLVSPSLSLSNTPRPRILSPHPYSQPALQNDAVVFQGLLCHSKDSPQNTQHSRGPAVINTRSLSHGRRGGAGRCETKEEGGRGPRVLKHRE